jgi:uncharacterized membrane protein YobD (UPF0266 family)
VHTSLLLAQMTRNVIHYYFFKYPSYNEYFKNSSRRKTRYVITLANDQLDAQIFNTLITILYMYMFPAIYCTSSGGQIVLTQHLVSSLLVNDRLVHRLRKKREFFLNLCTGRSLIESDDTRCCVNTI